MLQRICIFMIYTFFFESKTTSAVYFSHHKFSHLACLRETTKVIHMHILMVSMQMNFQVEFLRRNHEGMLLNH